MTYDESALLAKKKGENSTFSHYFQLLCANVSMADTHSSFFHLRLSQDLAQDSALANETVSQHLKTSRSS